MPFVHATVLGGLPVVADVWFSGPDHNGEYDAGVDGLYWMKRDGSKGAPLSQKVMDRVEAQPYWKADVTEQANDWLSTHCPIIIRRSGQPDEVLGDWSEDFILLNGNPKA